MKKNEIDDLTDSTVLNRMMRDDELVVKKHPNGVELLELHDSENIDTFITERIVLEALTLKNSKLTEDIHKQKRKKWINQYRKTIVSQILNGRSCMDHYNYLTSLFSDAVQNITTKIGEINTTNTGTNRHNQDEKFEAVLDEILLLSKGKEFSQIHNRLQQRVKSNQESGEEYIDFLFKTYSKLLVGRIDLYVNADFWKIKQKEIRATYLRDNNFNLQQMKSERINFYLKQVSSQEIAKQYAESDFQQHIDEEVHAQLREVARKLFVHFKNNFRNNKLFKNVVGYISKMEFGRLRGFHFHVIIFMNGQQVQCDKFIMQSIGEYWMNVITKMRGSFHNCNAKVFQNDRYDYKRRGIGMIEHGDIEKQNILKKDVLSYLCKAEQFGRTDHSGKKYRVFSRGEMPKKVENKLGRPRKILH